MTAYLTGALAGTLLTSAMFVGGFLAGLLLEVAPCPGCGACGRAVRR